MKFKLILTFCTIICFVKRNHSSTQSRVFPEDLKKWCPHTDFCGDSSVVKQVETKPPNGSNVIPCCFSCSCATDCGRKRNCCTNEYDRFNLEEKLDTICKQLNTVIENIERDEPFYHIINKCQNRSELCTSPDELVSSSYYPVYSTDSGMLYYNERCASCHKQRHTVPLIPIVSCEKLTVSYFPRFSAIMNGLISSDCVLRFLIPDGIDISTEVCYPFSTRACSPKKPSSATYAEACNSFNATFRTNQWTNYRNVYCYLCLFGEEIQYSHWIKTNEFCPANHDRKTFIETTTFMLLFEKSFEEKELYDIRSNDEKYRLWCVDETKKLTCRPVLCPEGQDFYRGKCRYVGDRWRFKYFRMNVKLVLPTGTKLKIDDLGNYSDPSYNITLERPELQNYQVTILYHQDLNGTYIRYLVAMLSKESLTIVPSKLIEKTKKSFQSIWKLHVKGQIIALKPKLHKYIRYEPLTENEDMIFHEPLPTNHDDGFTSDRNELLNVIYADVPFNQLKDLVDAVFLTKLFFCDIIELEEQEVKSKPPRLLLEEKGRYLESGEYGRIFDEFGALKARICLNDLQGFSKSSKMKLSYLAQCSFLILHILNLKWSIKGLR